ncbi:MAG: hypothetical protein ACPG6P_05380, partial [Akkermansiaceae bacterium]
PRRRPVTWPFFLALFGPCLLWFSYAFSGKLALDHLDFLIWLQLGWIVVSVAFCTAWTATKDLRKKPDAGAIVLGIILYPVLQVFLHLIITFIGLPVASMING